MLQDADDPSKGLHLTIMDTSGSSPATSVFSSLAGLSVAAVLYAVDDPHSFHEAASTVRTPEVPPPRPLGAPAHTSLFPCSTCHL